MGNKIIIENLKAERNAIRMQIVMEQERIKELTAKLVKITKQIADEANGNLFEEVHV